MANIHDTHNTRPNNGHVANQTRPGGAHVFTDNQNVDPARPGSSTSIESNPYKPSPTIGKTSDNIEEHLDNDADLNRQETSESASRKSDSSFVTNPFYEASIWTRSPVWSSYDVTNTSPAELASIHEFLTDHKNSRATLKYRPIPNKEITFTGYIDSISPSKMVMIRGRPNAGELRWLSLSFIQEVKILDPPAPATMPLPIIPVSQEEIQARVARTLAEDRQLLEHMGQGVDKGVQELYDAMRRMLPDCKWSGTSFIVNGSALVEPPYGVENVKTVDGAKGAEKNVVYVKKVLESEKKKLAERASSSGTQSPAPGQRKGG